MQCILILLLVIVVGCGPSLERGEVGFVKIGEVSFDAPPGFVSVNPALIHLMESDSGDYIFVYNHIAKNFQYIGFPSGKLVHEVPLRFEGPDNVQGFTGGTPTDQDSIWVTFYPPGIGLINFNGEVLLKRKVENDLFTITTLGGSSYRALTRYGEKVYGPQPYFMNHHSMTKDDIRKHQLIYSYDLKKDSVQWYDVFYADDYWDQGKKLTEFSWAEKDGKLYIAPFYDHELQVFDMYSEEVIHRKTVKSAHINHFDYVNELPSIPNEGFINRLKYDRYGTLIYDKYRDVFYRIFLSGFEPEEDLSEEDLRMLNWSRPDMGIMILDKDLNILGEHLFDKFEVYSYSNHFVGREGLYLSINNLFHPDYDEDRFRYIIVKPELDR